MKTTMNKNVNGAANGALNGIAPNAYANGNANGGEPKTKPTMLDKAILLQIDIKRMGNSRNVSTEQIEVKKAQGVAESETDNSAENAAVSETDKSLLHVSKKLLDCPEYKAITSLDDEMKAYVRSKCLPSVLRKGVFLLPISSIEKVNTRLEEFASTRAQRVSMFVAVYESAKAKAEERLGSLFNEKDYPPVELVSSYFDLSWNYLTFGVPDALGKISKTLFEQEQQKANAQWQEAQGMVQDLLRVRMQELVKHLTDRLTPGADGKPKIFKSSLISNIDEFLTEFDSLNVSDDGQLAEVVAKAKDLMNGVDAEMLRKSKDLQTSLQNGFAQIENQLAGMITEKPKRAISFEDV